MNFRDEYKKEMSALMPDEQAMERIRRGAAEGSAASDIPKRKPFPMRRVAAICGSAAACLIIGATAVIMTSGFRSIANDANLAGGAGNSSANNAQPEPSYTAGDTVGAAGGDNADGADAPAEETNSAPQFDNGMYAESEGSKGADDGLTDAAGDTSHGSEGALIEFSDGGVTLTLNGAVTRFAERPSADLPQNGAPSAGGIFQGAQTVTGDGTDNITTDDDSADEEQYVDPTAPETEFIEAIADNGETVFIKTAGGVLWVYDIDYKLSGVYFEV